MNRRALAIGGVSLLVVASTGLYLRAALARVPDDIVVLRVTRHG
jgi:hypothetical protein